MVRFVAFLPVGVLFMVGVIAPVGFLTWIPAAILAGLLFATGLGSPRSAFPFVAGLGLTLIGLGLINGKYVSMIFYGTVLFAAGTVGFNAFGPRTSHADPPETFD